jgi:hypothetical protein
MSRHCREHLVRRHLVESAWLPALGSRHSAPGKCVTFKIPAVLKNRGYRRRLFVPLSWRRRLMQPMVVCANGCSNSSAGAVPNPPPALLPSASSRSQLLADVTGCPNATQPEPFTVSDFFLRPRKGNWQAICGIWPDWPAKAVNCRVLDAEIISVLRNTRISRLKFGLTVRA